MSLNKNRFSSGDVHRFKNQCNAIVGCRVFSQRNLGFQGKGRNHQGPVVSLFFQGNRFPLRIFFAGKNNRGAAIIKLLVCDIDRHIALATEWTIVNLTNDKFEYVMIIDYLPKYMELTNDELLKYAQSEAQDSVMNGGYDLAMIVLYTDDFYLYQK